MTKKVIVTVMLLAAVGAFAQSAKWIVSKNKDPLSDENIVLFALVADEGHGVYGDPVHLGIRFSGDSAELFLSWATFLTTNDAIRVAFRIDSDPASESDWLVSTDQKSTFFVDDIRYVNTRDLLNRLLKARKVVAKVTPYGESPIVATFDVHRFEAEIGLFPEIRQWIEDAGAN